MPPPTLNPQGSRAGLITAVVILAIAFVTSAIFAFYSYSENSKTGQTLKSSNEKLNQYASPDAQGDAAVQALVEAKSEPKYLGQSAIQVAVMKMKEQAQTIGQLGGSVASLETEKKNLTDAVAQKDQQLADAAAKLKAEIATRATLLNEYKGKYDEQGTQLAAALDDMKKRGEVSESTVQKIQAAVDLQVKTAQAAASKAQQDLTQAESQIVQLKQENDSVKLRIPRPPKVGDAVVRQADGRIVRVPGNDNVYIDLGSGDQISVGLTFEVYDRFGGVPGLPEEDDASSGAEERELPKGKAAIEVIRVGAGQSECRIIRQALGQPVIEGDIIANLVYDKNTKFNFVVFGDFDLDQNKIATPEDARVVKRLVTQWGGKVQDDVAVSTDFVVLGAQPEIPPQEENPTPQDILRQDEATKKLEAYNDVISKARGLHVPILNQNRFLYYVGYYEQSQR